MLISNFWQQKKLIDFTEQEWESLCDGCGKCCYQQFISQHRKKKILYQTRIACNFLELNSGKCEVYSNRFKVTKNCTKITKKNLKDCYWLPPTCAYRLLFEGKPLYDWHPLISGDPNSVRRAHVMMEKGVHEKDVIDWFDFVVETEQF